MDSMATFSALLADRVLGQRKSVILGGVLMAIGQFMLMSEHLFFPALMCLIVGNGAGFSGDDQFDVSFKINFE